MGPPELTVLHAQFLGAIMDADKIFLFLNTMKMEGLTGLHMQKERI